MTYFDRTTFFLSFFVRIASSLDYILIIIQEYHEDKWGFGVGTKTIKRKTGFWVGLRIWALQAGLDTGRTMLN